MRVKDIEETFDAIKEGSYDLDDFKSWLAMWAVKVLDIYEDNRGTGDDLVPGYRD